MRVLVRFMRTQSSTVVKFINRFHLLAMTEKGFISADRKKNDTLLSANDGTNIDCFKILAV